MKSLSEFPELEQLKDAKILAFGFDMDDGEWCFVMSNGCCLWLSAGDDEPYFQITEAKQ